MNEIVWAKRVFLKEKRKEGCARRRDGKVNGPFRGQVEGRFEVKFRARP
jgi:hypothetical protein